MDAGIPTDWPRPLKLLVACLGVDAAAADRAGDLAQGMTQDDWAQFEKLVISQHKVAPTIAPILKTLDLPDAVRDRLGTTSRKNALKALVQIAETRKIRDALTAIDAEPVILKGWPLGAKLYGNASQRDIGDLDLLVPQGKVWQASAALEELGYLPSEYTAKFRRRSRSMGNDRLIKAIKDIELINKDTGVVLELHWRLLNYDGWDEFLDRAAMTTRQDTQAGPVLTLNEPVNLVFLSTHGALHLWDRLKWLADIAAFAKARGTAELTHDLQMARTLGLGYPVEFALGLAGQLFASPVPNSLKADAKIARLEEWTLNRLGQMDKAVAGWRYQAGIRWMAMNLTQNWRQVLGVVGYDTTRRLQLLSLDLGRQK